MVQRTLPLYPPNEGLPFIPLGVYLLIVTVSVGLKLCIAANLVTTRIFDPSNALVLEFSFEPEGFLNH